MAATTPSALTPVYQPLICGCKQNVRRKVQFPGHGPNNWPGTNIGSRKDAKEERKGRKEKEVSHGVTCRTAAGVAWRQVAHRGSPPRRGLGVGLLMCGNSPGDQRLAVIFLTPLPNTLRILSHVPPYDDPRISRSMKVNPPQPLRGGEPRCGPSPRCDTCCHATRNTM
jgi:hypothetical protein